MIFSFVDIDFIAIRADTEGKAAQVSKVKDSIEISMKEDSSASQKALASIIIRLALAEAFAGHHCGVLVLDEPTANLDIENAESLVQNLGAYVVTEYCCCNIRVPLDFSNKI
jgi:DNA repair protein RAD50